MLMNCAILTSLNILVFFVGVGEESFKQICVVRGLVEL